MKLKTKYRLLLFTAIICVPLLLLFVSVLTSIIYDMFFKQANEGIPFYASFAYPTMLVLFFVSLLLLAFIFSKSINSLLNKINLLNKTIKELASNEKVPSKIDVQSGDELGELIRSVNLLIERTTYRELELKQQEELKKELLNKLRHDINTPLTAIRLQLFYLEEQSHEQRPVIQSLYQQIEYIAELTNELNLHSTDTLEHSYIVYGVVNIHELLENMVKKWDYLYSIHDIKLVFNSVNQDLNWTSNGLWLQRLFDNIFQNTLKHSNATKLEITIKGSTVTLKDNGIGFDTYHKSAGLGLKIINDIAKALQLDYTLQSNEEGTLFCLKLG